MIVPDGDLCAVVLAAGLGKRMHSSLPKVLHRVGGRPMVQRVLEAARNAGVAHAVVVTGSGAAAVQAAVERAAPRLAPLRVTFALQERQLGTGHAVTRALPHVRASSVLVLPGDAPLLDSGQLRALMEVHRRTGAGITCLSALMAHPTGYGRLLRDSSGHVARVVEERDATEEERAVAEIFTLVACFRLDLLVSALGECRSANAQGEIYLTDTIAVARGRGERVEAVIAERAEDVIGVNDRRALAEAEAGLRRRTLTRLMDAGVTVVDPATSFIDESVTIGADCAILPMTVLEGGCDIGPGCEIGPGAHIRESRLAAGCRVWHSVVEGSDLGPDCQIGPFAHLRPGCHLGRGVDIGNFAEVKNSVLGAGAKQHHHSYIGDADVGPGVNVGAGAITVNFDGRHKHRTSVGADAFIGCNVNLIAPLEVGPGAFLAAGSTLSKTVPPDALAIGRAHQVVKEGWAARRREPPQAQA